MTDNVIVAIALPVLLKYENSTYGVRLMYPENWDVEGGEEVGGGLTNVAYLSSPYDDNGTYASVTLAVEDLSNAFVKTTLNDYANGAINY